MHESEDLPIRVDDEKIKLNIERHITQTLLRSSKIDKKTPRLTSLNLPMSTQYDKSVDVSLGILSLHTYFVFIYFFLKIRIKETRENFLFSFKNVNF